MAVFDVNRFNELVRAARPVAVTVNQPTSVLSQLLSGIQAGSVLLTSYYQGDAAVNAARFAAEQARYGGGGAQSGYVQGAVSGGVQTSQSMTPLLLIGGAALLLVVMSHKKSSR